MSLKYSTPPLKKPFNEIPPPKRRWMEKKPPWAQHVDGGWDMLTDHTVTCAHKLHNEIIGLMRWLSPTEHETHIRDSLHQTIEALVRENSKSATVDLFGSFISGLGIPQSDLDFNVTSEGMSLDALADILIQSEVFRDVQVVRKARVPVINCTHIETNIDLDFTLNNVGGRTTGLLSKQLLEQYPAAKPIVVCVKYMLRQRFLSNTNLGGLSSYSLCIMAVAMIQTRPKSKRCTGYGQLLVEFFKLYGLEFNYDAVGIDLNAGGFIPKPANAKPGILYLRDPADPNNNVSSATKKINYVRLAFAHCYHLLTAQSIANSDDGTLLGRIIDHDSHLTSVRKHLAKCSVSNQRRSTVTQVDCTPFIPPPRPAFLNSPTLSFTSMIAPMPATKPKKTNRNGEEGVVRKRRKLHKSVISHTDDFGFDNFLQPLS